MTTTYKVRVRCGGTVHYDYVDASTDPSFIGVPWDELSDKVHAIRAECERLYKRDCSIVSVSKAIIGRDGRWK